MRDSIVLNRAKTVVGTGREGIKQHFLDLLFATQGFNCCQDPRDLLYSRLPLAHHGHLLIPNLDYTLPVETVYREFAAECIVRDYDLRILKFIQTTMMHIPSWAPDWFSWMQFPTEAEVLLPREINADGIHWHSPILEMSQDHNELRVSGRLLRVVIYPMDDTLHRDKPRIGDWLCLLYRCPTAVFLRRVRNYFTIVGRKDDWHQWALKSYLAGAVSLEGSQTDKVPGWCFRDLAEVQSYKQRSFKIR